MEDKDVIGIGMIRFDKHLDRSIKGLAENGGGLVGFEGPAFGINILERLEG
jgi:hypothetical protein